MKRVRKGESETMEFKSSLSDVDRIVEEVSALANTRSGTVVIGVSNAGKVLGVEIGERTVEKLTNKIISNTEPKIYPKISVEKIDGKGVIFIEVEESQDKPVIAFGKAFKRVGRSTVRMSKDEYERMILEKRKIYWDEQTCGDASLEDIDWNFVKNFFIPRYEEFVKKKIAGKPEQLLESLNCVKNKKPTNAGILLFGKTPQKTFMNAYIALARYKGKEVGTERLDYKEFTGNLFQQIDDCDTYIKEHIAVMSKLLPDRVERQDIPEYGWFSIRELITNAACHREYVGRGSKIIVKIFDDRIEFYNPGSLPLGITPKNITRKQFSRNPTISRVLAKVKYIEELGEGWDKIVKEHKEHPLKPVLPKLEVDKLSTSVTIFSVREKFREKKILELSERQRRIIALLKEEGRITTRSCAALLNVSQDTALREISTLLSKGIIKRKGAGRGTCYVTK